MRDPARESGRLRVLADQLGRDVAFAWRRLRATPVFLVFAVASLSLGVGVTSAVFSAMTSLMWRPLSVADADRIAVLIGATPYGRQPTWRGPVLSRPDFDDLRATATSFSSLAATKLQQTTMTGAGLSEVPQVEAVTGPYFEALGVAASLGRVLQPADDRPGAPAVVVLGHRFWQTKLNADPAIIGRVVRIAGQPFEIVGVAQASFGGLGDQFMTVTAAWVPLVAAASFGPTPSSAAEAARRDRPELSVLGRLTPGRSVEEAGAELSAIGQRLDVVSPRRRRQANGSTAPLSRMWTAKTAADVNAEITDVQTPISAIIVGLVGLVLMVACTNLANLVLARGSSRRHEFAVRRALGASRRRLVQEQLAESVLLAGFGTVGAYLVTRYLLVALAMDLPVAQAFVIQITPRLDGRVLLVAGAAMAVSLVVFGLVPALHLSRVPLRAVLATEAGTGAPRWRTRRSLISWQVAISAAFFLVAGFGAEVIVAQARHDSGVDVDRLALGFVDFHQAPWNETTARRAIEAVLQEGRRQPAIDSLALSSGMPFGVPTGSYLDVTTLDKPFNGTQRGEVADLLAATPGIFRTLDVAILQGRAFDERDSATEPSVVVVSEHTARALFGTTAAVGRQILSRGAMNTTDRTTVTTRTIIGVARDTDTTFLFLRGESLVYLPFAQHYEPRLVLLARATGDPAPLVATLRRIVSHVDPDLAMDARAGTGPLMLTGMYVFIRILASLTASLALLALILSMVGLYGVLTHLVSRRTREMGIRMALGADAGRIRRLVLGDGLRPVLEGLALGLCVGLLARLAIRAQYRLPFGAMDVVALVLSPVPLVLSALLACYLPARRACHVEPNVALRE
jgi:putative ABC transport system permease protein